MLSMNPVKKLYFFAIAALLWCTAFVAICAADEFTRESYVPYDDSGTDAHCLDVYLHPSPGPCPAIIYVHGGGFVGGDKDSCPSYILEPAMHHGFSVISANYRLAPIHSTLVSCGDRRRRPSHQFHLTSRRTALENDFDSLG
jgi:acetyl esterase/lipase